MFLLMLNTVSIGLSCSLLLSLSCPLFRFQGLVFVVVLVQAVGLVVVVEFEEFVAVVVGISEHPIFLWLHSRLALTQGLSRPYAEIVLWTCCQTGLEHEL